VGAGAAEVTRQFTVDVGERSDAVAVHIQLLVIHQSTLLSKYDRLHVGKVRQRVNQLQLCHLRHATALAILRGLPLLSVPV